MTHYRLISFRMCAFVQRASIVLHEKGVAHDVEFIDLYDKPAWFSAISPLGKVPVLEVDGRALLESAAIAEYLNEAVPGRPLHPTDDFRRAQNRAAIELVSAAIMDMAKIMMAAEEADGRAAAELVRAKLAHLESGHSGEGPFYNGDELNLIDAAFAPLAQRLHWMNDVTALGFFEGLPRVARWRDALITRASVVACSGDLHAVFLEYLRGHRSPSNIKPPSFLGRVLDGPVPA